MDAAGDEFVMTCYDAAGRPSKTTNPFRGYTNQTCSTTTGLDWTTSAYDTAGRPSTITTPDGAAVSTGYSLAATTGYLLGTVTTVTDQSGKLRRSVTNALGQLARVDEPTSGGLGSVTAPNQATYYTYDTLGNMVTVQQGSQYRYFLYNSLGRLLRVRQPEQDVNGSLAMSGHPTNSGWTAGFTYDNNGNVLTTTDAKNVTVTNNTYDALNRPASRSYSDGTPTVNFYYDGNGVSPTPSYAKGKLTKVANSVSESRYTQFDVAGRLLQFQQYTDSNTYTSSYVYSLSGALKQETYPSGRVVNHDYDVTGNIARIYGKPTSTATEQTYANAFSYFADGKIEKLRLGNNVWEAAKLNSRLQVTELAVGHSVGDGGLVKLNYE